MTSMGGITKLGEYITLLLLAGFNQHHLDVRPFQVEHRTPTIYIQLEM
jgi:hypothetical protein